MIYDLYKIGVDSEESIEDSLPNTLGHIKESLEELTVPITDLDLNSISNLNLVT